MLERSICLRVRLLIAIGIFLSFAQGSLGLAASSSDLPETREAKELSALEPKVVFLCEYARFEATPEMRSYLAELSDSSLDSVNLVALLKSPNPKIRSTGYICSWPQVRSAFARRNCAAAIGP
jgi:hypothetical protein